MRPVLIRSAAALVVLTGAAVLLKLCGGMLSPPARLYLECTAVLIFVAMLAGRRGVLVTVYVGMVLLSLCLYEAIMQMRGLGGDGRAASVMTVTGAERYGQADSRLGTRPSVDDGTLRVVKTIKAGELVFDAHYTFRNGFREGFRAAPAGAAAPVAWFLGCSLTFGEGVNDAQTLAARFSERAAADTYNFAFPGWGPHQALWLWEQGELTRRAPPPQLVVFSSFPGHAQRCAGKAHWDYDGPHYRADDQGAEYLGSHRATMGVARLHWLLTRLGIMQTRSAGLLSALLGRPTPEDGQLCVRLVAELARKSQAAGAQFVVVDWRAKSGDGEIGETMAAALAHVAPVLEVRSLFDPADAQYQIVNDGHPNAAALDRLAQALNQRYGAALRGHAVPPS